jgi:hypothetical protein
MFRFAIWIPVISEAFASLESSMYDRLLARNLRTGKRTIMMAVNDEFTVKIGQIQCTLNMKICCMHFCICLNIVLGGSLGLAHSSP